MVRAPATTFAGLAARPRIGWAIMVATVITAIGSTFSTLGLATAPESQPLQGLVAEHTAAFLLGSIAAAPLLAVASTALWAVLAGWLGRMFDGGGSFRGTFTAFSFSILPTLLSAAIQPVNAATDSAVVALALLPLSLAVFGWTAVLWVLATREALRITTGSAVAVVGLMAAMAFVAMLTASVLLFPTAMA